MSSVSAQGGQGSPDGAAQTDSELVLDQNAKVIDGKVYVPNSEAVIKGDTVFVPEPNAKQNGSDWCLPNGTVLDEVIVSSSTGTVYAADPEAKIKVLDDGTKVAYTVDQNASVDDAGNIYTATGGQPMPTSTEIPESQTGMSQTDIEEAAAIVVPDKPDEVSQGSVVIKGQLVQDSTGRPLILIDPAKQNYEVIYPDKENMTLTNFEPAAPEEASASP